VTTVARWQDLHAAIVTGTAVAVIDVLRWSTVTVTALERGAERVESFATPGRARARAEELGRDQVLLGGERGNRALPGFDVGNSPAEYTRARVNGRTIVTTTTNGTQALLAAEGAREVVVAGFRNLDAVSSHLRRALEEGSDVVLVAAGQDGVEALEDTGCAGAIADALLGDPTSPARGDAATTRALDFWRSVGGRSDEVMARSPHAQALRTAGFGDDVTFCASRDASRIVPVLGLHGCVPHIPTR
jgi:2-phosphosulfolactate phosphatase